MRSLSDVVDGNEWKIIALAFAGILALLVVPALSEEVDSSKTDLLIPIPTKTILVEPVTDVERKTTFIKLVVSESLVLGTVKLIAGSD